MPEMKNPIALSKEGLKTSLAVNFLYKFHFADLCPLISGTNFSSIGIGRRRPEMDGFLLMLKVG